MNLHEAALDYETSRERDAASGRDNPHTRVGVRDDGCDDNGEPLCSEEPAPIIWHGREPAKGTFHAAIIGIVRSAHHINTEGV